MNSLFFFFVVSIPAFQETCILTFVLVGCVWTVWDMAGEMGSPGGSSQLLGAICQAIG